MKLSWILVAAGISSASSMAVSNFTTDSNKLQTILNNRIVADKFFGDKGVDAISRLPAQFADLIAYRVQSGNCWLLVNLRADKSTIDPRFEVSDVGEWECAAPKPVTPAKPDEQKGDNVTQKQPPSELDPNS